MSAAGGYTYDLFNPAARAFAWGAMQKGYVEQYGLHHWWLDCDEPCGLTNNGTEDQLMLTRRTLMVVVHRPPSP